MHSTVPDWHLGKKRHANSVQDAKVLLTPTSQIMHTADVVDIVDIAAQADRPIATAATIQQTTSASPTTLFSGYVSESELSLVTTSCR